MPSKDIKSTFKHALVYSGASILGKAVGFIMLPVYAHFLRGEGYGIIGMIDVVLSVLTLLIGYGISGALLRYYFEKETVRQKNVLVSTTIILMFILVLIVCLPVLLLNKQIAYLAFGKYGMEYYITLAVLTFIANMTSKNAEAYILIKQQSIFFSVLSLSKLILGLSLNIYLIVYLRLGVLGYLYSGLIVAIVFTLIMHLNALIRVGLHFDRRDAKAILKFSLPLLPGYIMMFIRTNADRVILRTYLGLTQLGAFEMLFKFATLIGVLITEPFGKIWNVKRFEICNSKEGPQTMARVFTLQLGIMMFLGLILSLEIPIILKILTPEEFWLSGNIAFLAVMSRIIMASYYHMFFGLLHSKLTHKISFIQFVSTVINVSANLVLIKHYGIYGAVISSCIVNLIQCVIAYSMSKRYYHIPFEWNRVFQMVFIAVVLFFGIDFISVTKIGISGWLDSTFGPVVAGMMEFFNLDTIKGGKLLAYAVGNIPVIADGCIKLCLSFTFLFGLIFIGVIPKEKVLQILRLKNISKPLNVLMDK